MTEKDIEQLSGGEKVAVILLSLSQDNVTKVFSLMTEQEIMEISRSMSTLGPVKAKLIEEVINQVSDDLSYSNSFLGNLYTTEKLLNTILEKDKVQSLMEEIRGPQGKNTWEKLSNVNEELLALYFSNEHPQTAALVLSKINPDHAAKVLANLPDVFAFDVVSRLLNLGTVKKEFLESVENVVRLEFITTFRKTQAYDSFEMLAEIFNNLDRNTESKFMAMLETKIPDAANKIKDKMFTFNDLIKLGKKGMQRLLTDIDRSRLTLALKGCPSDLKNMIYSGMTQRAVKIIEEDLTILGAVRAKDVDVARSEIVIIAKGLIDAGEIDINFSDDSDDELIA